MAAQCGQSGPFRFHEAPIATPIATPTASQTPMLPAITPKTAPSAAPSAMPSPAYLGLLAITHSYADSASDCNSTTARHGGADEASAPYPSCYAFGNSGGFGRLVADLPYLAQQFRHRHARERLEQRRHLRRHLGDVAGDLVHPRGFAVSGGDDRDLVDVGQRSWPAPSPFPACWRTACRSPPPGCIPGRPRLSRSSPWLRLRLS